MFRHAALNVGDLAANRAFYERIFGLKPYHVGDKDWLMLDLDGSTLSLVSNHPQHPAHLGFVVTTPEQVDAFYARVLKEAPESKPTKPKRHRDESYGFYLFDPSGNALECIFIPARASRSGAAVSGVEFLILTPGQLDSHQSQEILQGARYHLRQAKVQVASIDDDLNDLEFLAGGSLVVVPWVMALDRPFSHRLEQTVLALRVRFPKRDIRLIEPLGRHPTVQSGAWAILANFAR